MSLFYGYEDPQRKVGQEDIIMAYNKIITQSAVPTNNNYLINKGYVDANITPFDSKILMFSINSDGYYHPTRNPFIPLICNPTVNTKLQVEYMFIGSSMSDSDIQNRQIQIMLRTTKENGSTKTVNLKKVNLKDKNTIYASDRMYNINYSLKLSYILGSLYNEYRIFYVMIQALGNTPQIQYELKL